MSSKKMKTPKRLPMRLWIKQKLDEGEYPEMRWVNKEKGKFQVSWRHGSRSDWCFDRDMQVFREWGIYTGKYCPERSVESSAVLCKRLKTNFRCALNSLPEIEQLREESDGRGQNAKKVYIMKPTKSNKTKSRKTKEIRRQMSTELAPCDREIIEIVNQMEFEHDMSWPPFPIGKDNGLAEIRELIEKGQIFQPYTEWHSTLTIGAC